MQTSDNELIVWGIGTPRTFRVYWALEAFEVPYRYMPVKPRTPAMDDAAFLAVSPGKKIPALEDGSVKLVESGAIVFHVFEKYSSQSQTGLELSETLRWSFFALMELDATALYVIRRHQGLPEIYGQAPTAVQSAKEYFDRQIEVVNRVLSDGRKYMVGDALSPADILIASCCDWAIAYELNLPADILSYHSNLKALPSYQRAHRRNYA